MCKIFEARKNWPRFQMTPPTRSHIIHPPTPPHTPIHPHARYILSAGLRTRTTVADIPDENAVTREIPAINFSQKQIARPISQVQPGERVLLHVKCIAIWEKQILLGDATGIIRMDIKSQLDLKEGSDYELEVDMSEKGKRRIVQQLLRSRPLPVGSVPSCLRKLGCLPVEESRLLLLKNKNSPVFIEHFWFKLLYGKPIETSYFEHWFDEEIDAFCAWKISEDKFIKYKILRNHEIKILTKKLAGRKEKEAIINAAQIEKDRRWGNNIWGTYTKKNCPHYSLPKGEADEFGKDWETAVRKFKNETGLKVGVLRKKDKDWQDFRIDDNGMVSRFFVMGPGPEGKFCAPALKRDGEYDEAVWIEIEDIQKDLENFWTLMDLEWRNKPAVQKENLITQWQNVLNTLTK